MVDLGMKKKEGKYDISAVNTTIHNRILCETLNCQIRSLVEYQPEVRFKEGEEEFTFVVNLKDLLLVSRWIVFFPASYSWIDVSLKVYQAIQCGEL